jgi:hypothetical protein
LVGERTRPLIIDTNNNQTEVSVAKSAAKGMITVLVKGGRDYYSA